MLLIISKKFLENLPANRKQSDRTRQNPALVGFG